MNILNFLRHKKSLLLQKKQLIDNVVKLNDTSNIEIEIENSNNLFKDEEKIIMEGAKTLLENGNVDNIQEGVIVFATMIRGLKYKRIEKNENGNIKIILKDIDLEKSNNKKY